MTDKHFPLAVGQRVTVKVTGLKGTIVDIDRQPRELDKFKVEYGWVCAQDWFYASELTPHLPVEPIAYAIVSPPKGEAQVSSGHATGKIVARVGSHTPVLAPFVCVRLTSDARNAIGDTLDFKIDPDKGAIEVVRAEPEASAALKRSRDIEAAATRVAKEYAKWLDGKYIHTATLFTACRHLLTALERGQP